MSNDLKIEPLYSIFASLEGRSMARPVQHSYIVIRCLVFGIDQSRVDIKC